MKDIERQAYFGTKDEDVLRALIWHCQNLNGTLLLKCFICHKRGWSRSSLKTACSILHRVSAFQVSRHYMWNENPKSSDSRHAWLWQPLTKLYCWICTEGISLFLFNVYRTLKSLHGTNNKQDGAWVAFSGKNILGQRIVLRRRMICVTKQFPKEFGQGVWQQRVRDKKKEKARTLPLDLRMIRRARKWKRCWNARRAASLRRRTTWISSAWNSFSSHCRERCSYLKKQLVTLFKALFPSYYSGGPSSKQWWHLWAHHAYKLTWAVGRSQYIL